MSHALDTSNELSVFRYKNGIKLVRSDNHPDVNNGHFTGQSIKSLMAESYSVYFDNKDAVIQKLNTHNVELCGFYSESHAIGKSYFSRFTTNTARTLRQYDMQSMKEESTKIYQETIQYHTEEESHQLLSVKMPWYSVENKVIGLFGCCTFIKNNSMEHFLNSIIAMGLLNIEKVQFTNENKLVLPKQLRICAMHLSKGLTNNAIAQKMNLSRRTIEAYVDALKNKLHCKNKMELVIKISKNINDFLSY